jgi:hypothetical protein
MQEQTSTPDLKERLALIESMIAEGRRRTQSWGWIFVLWGVAYFVAIGWATQGRGLSVWGSGHNWAWPITMLGASVVTLIIGIRKGRGEPITTIGRAIPAVWISVGISDLFLCPALAAVGRLDQHAFVALVAAMLGAANGASGFILRWKSQIVCAIVWWITSAAACFGSIAQLTVVFLAAIFLCQIVFGVYTMILEARRRVARGVVHA